MKTFEMKTVIHFGDNALDRLAELPYKKVLVNESIAEPPPTATTTSG